MPVIYLIRHGQASLYSDDYDQLSEIGRKQSLILGKQLASRGIAPETIETGTLNRHRQTMEGCLEGMQQTCDYTTREEWNEYDHQDLLLKPRPQLGSFSEFVSEVVAREQPTSYLERALKKSVEDWLADKYEYQETWAAFKSRVNTRLSALAGAMESGETAIIFTSGGPISVALMRCLTLPDKAFIQLQHTIVNASISKFIVSKGQIRLSSLNEHGYLESAKGLLTYR